jgi:hypothetical protein
MISLNPSGFACSFNEENLDNLVHDQGGKKEFGNKRSRRGRFYNVLSCLNDYDPIKTFWTFTVAEKQANFEDTDREITSKFSALLKNLMRRHARGQPNGLKNYVWVSEAQSRGNIHYHLVTSTKFISVQYVQDLWNELLNQVSKNSVHVDPVEQNDIKNVSAYFAKYMSKNWESRETECLKNRVIFARSFGYSKNFPIHDKLSIHPYELQKLFPDINKNKVTKEVSPGVFVDYYFFETKKVLDLLREKEAEREATLLGLSKSTQSDQKFTENE